MTDFLEYRQMEILGAVTAMLGIYLLAFTVQAVQKVRMRYARKKQDALAEASQKYFHRQERERS